MVSMKNFLILFFGLFVILSINNVVFAGEASYSKDVTQKLLVYKYKIHALQDLAQDGIITKMQAEGGIQEYVNDAKEIGGESITLNDLMLLTAPETQKVELTALQKFAGYITFVNILWVIAIGLGVLCLGYLSIHWCKWLFEIFKYIPIQVYEVLFYLLSIAFMVGGYFLSAEIGPYVSFTGCLLFAGAIILTSTLHKMEEDPVRFFSILFVVYVIAALVIQSKLIGFIAVMALMGALGFSAAVIPCGYVIGFKDKDSLGRVTSVGFIMLTAFVVIRLTAQNIPLLQLFENGALFLGSFVGYLGLLIASSRWYGNTKENYFLMQVITIIAGIIALVVGSIWNIGELQKIGGTFFVLYLIEKPFEIPVEKGTHYATIGLVMSVIIYLGCVFAKANPALVNTFLFYPF